jgi:hypothetical protein
LPSMWLSPFRDCGKWKLDKSQNRYDRVLLPLMDRFNWLSFVVLKRGFHPGDKEI